MSSLFCPAEGKSGSSTKGPVKWFRAVPLSCNNTNNLGTPGQRSIARAAEPSPLYVPEKGSDAFYSWTIFYSTALGSASLNKIFHPVLQRKMRVSKLHLATPASQNVPEHAVRLNLPPMK